MPTSTLEDRVLRLEARCSIEDLIRELGKAFDSGPSASMLERLFAEDAVFKIDRYGTLTGRKAIAEGVSGNAQSGFRWTLHYLVSPRIDLSADAASAEVEFNLWEVATAASGKAYWIGGRYLAHAIAAPGGWRFARLELKADLISHYPEGWHEKPEALDQA